jgi:hypothetical protein
VRYHRAPIRPAKSHNCRSTRSHNERRAVKIARVESELQSGTPHEYDDRDRRAQLQTLADASARLSVLFGENGDTDRASGFARIADSAANLLGAAFSHDDLKALAFALPHEPEWLNPKYLDFDGPREAWQDDVAKLDSSARRVALELRAIATYERP